VARDLRVDGSDWAEAVRIAPALPPVRREIEGHREAILASRLSIRKHSCGYQLVRIVEALQRGVFPLAELFVGSEGTLGVVTEVVGRIVSRYRLSRPPEVATDAATQARLWKLRRSVFPTIIQRPGARKAWGFVEDPIVPRDRVPEFIEYLVDLTRRHGTVAGIYGHIGDGNTHYRPLFDPTDPPHLQRMRSLREEFDHAVLTRFQGAPSGEHGIGRLRAETLPRIWGADVYGVMRSIKDAFDPRGLLNPGVLFSDEPWWASWGGLESRVPM